MIALMASDGMTKLVEAGDFVIHRPKWTMINRLIGGRPVGNMSVLESELGVVALQLLKY